MPQNIANQDTPDPQAASSPIWQYDSPNYDAAGSLPMLSLFMPETPTQPQSSARSKATRRLPRVDEIDTMPPQLSPARDIDQIDTIPPGQGHTQRALIPAPRTAPGEIGSQSWTAGSASGSPSAQLIMRSTRRKHLQVATFNPVDRTRWWLLRPGRIEFILWLGGTLLLIGMTCLLLLVSALSFQWIAPFAPSSTLSRSAGNSDTQHSVSPAGTGPIIMLSDSTPLVLGQSFGLRGQGFKPSSLVTFYFDNKFSLLNQSHLSASTHTDARGKFEDMLWLGTGSNWSPGAHIIITRDASGAQSASLRVQVVASANNAVANSSPVPASTPGGTHTGTPNPGGPQSTPVGLPPVSVTPTPSPTKSTPTVTPTVATSPTVTPTIATSPTVTPTVATSPTVTPTVKTSPTPAITPASGTPTPAVSPTAANTGLSNALNDSGMPPFAARLASVSPLIWIMVACYLLSMMFLGVAGIVHRWHRN
jgi:hypothetical protein